jgi:hypothetical protein
VRDWPARIEVTKGHEQPRRELRSYGNGRQVTEGGWCFFRR